PACSVARASAMAYCSPPRSLVGGKQGVKRILKISAVAVLPTLLIAAVVIANLRPHGAAAASSGSVYINPNTDGAVGGSDVDTGSAIILLTGDPLSTYVRTKPTPGKKIDLNSNTTKSYRAQLSAERNDFKKWLQANAPTVNVNGSFDISLNAVAVSLNGTPLATLMAAPMVANAQYQLFYHPASSDPGLDNIHAIDAWNARGGGPPTPTAGQGVKVAIIDTGIDFTHPCFSDTGYPAQTRLGDTSFTNNKVIAARVFNNKTPSRHFTPEAL